MFARILQRIGANVNSFPPPPPDFVISYSLPQGENENLCCRIKEVFDVQFDNLTERFRILGLDDGLVSPSYVINTSSLQEKIKKSMDANPELNYHKDNDEFLKNIMAEVSMMVRRGE